MNQQRRHRPWLPTVILIGIVVLLVLFVIFVLPNLNPPPKSGAQPTPVVFFEFEATDVVRISVTKGFLMTKVERADSEWRVVSPTPDEADNNRLNDLTLRIVGIRSTRALEDVVPVDFGLGEGAAQVTLGLADGTTVFFSIGDENPGRTGRYVQVAGDSRVHVVAASYVDGLLDMVGNPPYPPTPVPPPTPEQTPTLEEIPTETPTPKP